MFRVVNCFGCSLFKKERGSLMSKPSKTVPPGTPAEYMFETCEDFSCTCLTEGADLTVDDGKY